MGSLLHKVKGVISENEDLYEKDSIRKSLNRMETESETETETELKELVSTTCKLETLS